MPYTKYTDGITHGYWHNYEYRHLLRSPYDYRVWKKLKHHPSTKWWNAKYRQIYFALVAAGLEPSGFTIEHTKIIDKLLRFNGKVVAAYHGDEVHNDYTKKRGLMNKLNELVAVLNQERGEEDDTDFVTFERVRYKITGLPTWGADIDNTHNVWSWNETHYITQDLNSGKFMILPRAVTNEIT